MEKKETENDRLKNNWLHYGILGLIILVALLTVLVHVGMLFPQGMAMMGMSTPHQNMNKNMTMPMNNMK